jgi:hypothetical protein
MLYNVAEDGTISATKWATQTADRAKKVAEEMVSEYELFLPLYQRLTASTKAFDSTFTKARTRNSTNALDEKTTII